MSFIVYREDDNRVRTLVGRPCFTYGEAEALALSHESAHRQVFCILEVDEAQLERGQFEQLLAQHCILQ